MKRLNFCRPVRNNIFRDQQGMTLIEIMIVIAIIAGLMAVLGTNVMSSFNKSKVANTKVAMQEIKKSLDQYNLNCGSYPTTDQGLRALVVDPGKEVCPNWGESYIKEKQLKDQWNRTFFYESDGQKVGLRSLGADGKEGGDSYNQDINVDEI
jgi:general secretion pathway protein G